MNSIVVAFDFGLRHIGTAVGQRITATARPLVSLKARKGVPCWESVGTLMRAWQPSTLVVGLPLNMDGSEQPISQAARQFANCLQQRFVMPIVLHDERLSTIEARARLFTHGGYRALTKQQVDKQSAVIILESWLAIPFVK